MSEDEEVKFTRTKVSLPEELVEKLIPNLIGAKVLGTMVLKESESPSVGEEE